MKLVLSEIGIENKNKNKNLQSDGNEKLQKIEVYVSMKTKFELDQLQTRALHCRSNFINIKSLQSTVKNLNIPEN